ncbi:MAG: ATP synthase F1 subunit gamma [Bacteroidales bacterium]|nr:ATP synthase F1 subunit gamma [Bacteroidales bacterium]
MPTLKEIKGRISSVKSTLKITSAMKLVSSAKLRKAQNAIEAMRPYEATLLDMLTAVSGVMPGTDRTSRLIAESGEFSVAKMMADAPENSSASRPTVIIAIASNSSLCGGFNANVIAKVRSVRQPGDIVYSVGRKMADAMRRDGFTTPEDLNALIEHPSYGPAAKLVEKLADDCKEGRVEKVLLVYTHFVSTAKQVPVVETLLQKAGGDSLSVASALSLAEEKESSSREDLLIEPGRKELRAALEPKTLKLKLYAALLDSSAAEHAARTVAMQTATDNAENLLSELTLQYNKGRQQKITSEILDLAGGQTE